MTIKAIYNDKDFWGQIQFIESVKEYATIEDVKKGFRYLKKDREFALHIDNTSYVWDSYNDFENGVLTVRTYSNWNSCDIEKMSFEKAKKEALKIA